MGQIRIWMTDKDNPRLSEQEIAAQNIEWNNTINVETQNKINQEYYKAQGSKSQRQR